MRSPIARVSVPIIGILVVTACSADPGSTGPGLAAHPSPDYCANSVAGASNIVTNTPCTASTLIACRIVWHKS